MGDWTPNLETVAAQLRAITQEQAHLPQCRLCGQRTNHADAPGLCTKVDTAHTDYRAGRRPRTT